MKQLSAQLLRLTMSCHDNNALGDELRRLDDELVQLGGRDVDPAFIVQTAVFNAISLAVSSLHYDTATDLVMFLTINVTKL